MGKTLAQHFNQGNTEFARRIRSYYGLMTHIARIAKVNPSHVTRVIVGTGISRRVMRIATRELAKAESIGAFERAA